MIDRESRGGRSAGLATGLLPRNLRRSGQRGFALVTVIWSVGLISLLGVAAMVGARYRVQTTDNVIWLDTTTAAAESAVNLAVIRIMTPQTDPKFPLRCQMPGGEQVRISLEDEAGKVDLNTSTPMTLMRLFSALTRDPSTATAIVERIIAFRTPPKESDEQKTDNNKKLSFTTTLQLDQIDGVSSQLRRLALPFLTVRSGRPEPEPGAAPAALRAMLGLDQGPPTARLSLPGNFTIRADVEDTHGARFIREALVSIGDPGQNPLVIREWRRGDALPVASRRDMRSDDARGAMRSCFDVRNLASL